MTPDQIRAVRHRLIPIRNTMTTIINTCDASMREPERHDEYSAAIEGMLVKLKELTDKTV